MATVIQARVVVSISPAQSFEAERPAATFLRHRILVLLLTCKETVVNSSHAQVNDCIENRGSAADYAIRLKKSSHDVNE